MYIFFTIVLPYLLSCGVSAFLYFDFLRRIFGPKTRLAVRAAAFVAAWAAICAVGMLHIVALNMLLPVIVMLLAGRFLYRLKDAAGAMLVVLFLLGVVAAEFVGSLVQTLVVSGSFSIYAGNLWLDMWLVLCYLFAMAIVEKRTPRFKQTGLLRLCSVPALSLVIVALMLNSLSPAVLMGQISLVAAACVLLLLVNILVYAQFARTARISEENRRLAMAQQQRDMQKRRYEELEQTYTDTRRMLHDMRRHMDTLAALQGGGEGQTSEAAALSAALGARLDALQPKQLYGSHVLDVLLDSRAAMAAAKGIGFEVQAEPVDLAFISPLDLNTMLANLLDNAFEACEAYGPGAFVCLRLCRMNSFVIVQLQNSCENTPGGKPGSTKPGHMGVGQQNVRDAAARYNGTLHTAQQNGIYTAQLTFPGQG